MPKSTFKKKPWENSSLVGRRYYVCIKIKIVRISILSLSDGFPIYSTNCIVWRQPYNSFNLSPNSKRKIFNTRKNKNKQVIFFEVIWGGGGRAIPIRFLLAIFLHKCGDRKPVHFLRSHSIVSLSHTNLLFTLFHIPHCHAPVCNYFVSLCNFCAIL